MTTDGRSGFIAAIAGQESGGDYAAKNAKTGALGKYQVLPSNVAGWSKQVLGHSITPAQFLASPDLQEKIVSGVLGGYYDKYGARGAASAWYSGNPALSESTAPQNGGPSIKGYVDSVVSRASGTQPPTDPHLAGAVAGTTAPAAKTPFDPAQLASQFGYQAAFLNTDPSLKHWMGQALSGQFGDLTSNIGQAKATAALHGTKWYTTHTDAQRTWASLQTTDPGSVRAQIAAKTSDIMRTATIEGVTLDPATASKIAKDALANGLDDSHVKAAVDAQLKYNPKQALTGSAGQIHDQYAQLAASYGVPVTDQGLSQYVINTVQGKGTDEDFSNFLKQQASTLYPGLAKQIAAGQTTSQLASSYISRASQLLEKDPSQISLNDPLISKALQYNPSTPTKPATPGDANGGMPLWQFDNQVRADPSWQFTQNAKDSYQSAALNLAKQWGFQ